MPSIIPPSPIEGGSAGVGVASVNIGSGSLSTSRSGSPAPVEEAQDALSPNEDDDEESKKMAQARRKSSIWKKALNIKKRISKVNMVFADDGHRIGGVGLPTEGTPLSPIEVSPTTVELPPTASDGTTVVESQPKSSYLSEMDHIEKSIVQCLAEMNANSDVDEDNDDVDTAAVDRRSSVDPDADWKKRVIMQPHCLQTRRSDVSDDLVGKVSSAASAASAANIDSSGGACQLRPADLPLFDDTTGRPIPPPRQNANSRNQRLLSVPNIKYNRSISENPRVKAARKEPISIAANLMRRFSKYLHLERQKK